jgi:hypothetical protein
MALMIDGINVKLNPKSIMASKTKTAVQTDLKIHVIQTKTEFQMPMMSVL